MKALLYALPILLVGAAAWFFLSSSESQTKPAEVRSSDTLKRTVIVPTLDTPIPEGMSAIWCASFQMAWNEMKAKVVKGPVQFKDKNEAADRLNASPVTAKDLPPGSFYANAGWVKDGIAETIRKEMKEKFPDVTLPALDGGESLAVAFAWMQAALKFEHAFQETKVDFTGSNKQKVRVDAFGFEQSMDPRMRSQASLNFLEDVGNPGEAFSVNLRASPNSIRLRISVLPRPADLASGLKEVSRSSRQIEQVRNSLDHEVERLAIPTMHWDIEHHFTEVERLPIINLSVTNAGLYPAVQRTRFKLDRFGVEFKSEAHMKTVKSGERNAPKRVALQVDRPYLIELRVGGQDHPFFAMWVDNTELMQAK